MPEMRAAAAVTVDSPTSSSRDSNARDTESEDRSDNSSKNRSDTGEQPAAAAAATAAVDSRDGSSRGNDAPPPSTGGGDCSENCSKNRSGTGVTGEPPVTTAESAIVHFGWERKDGLPSFSLILRSPLAPPSTTEKACVDVKTQPLRPRVVPEMMPARGGVEAAEMGNGTVRVM